MSHPMTPPAPLPVGEVDRLLQEMLCRPQAPASGRRARGSIRALAHAVPALWRPRPAGRYRADGAR